MQKSECRVQNENTQPLTSDNLEVVGAMPESWMTELADMLILIDLPTRVIVGSAVIERCEKVEDGGSKIADNADQPTSRSSILNLRSSLYEWHLGGIERARKLRKPKGHPQPFWFTPFG